MKYQKDDYKFWDCCQKKDALKPQFKIAASLVFFNSIPEAIFLVVCDPSMNELWAT